MTVRIAALQGAASFVVQARLAEFSRARAAQGFRVAGCVEAFSGEAGPGCAGRELVDLVSGRRHVIGQDLGPGSLACHLDASGVADACEDALKGVEAGCDVLVLAKFGKLEAEGGGLLDALSAAAARDIPVVTSVAPQFAAAWGAYACDLAAYVEPNQAALEAWWRAVGPVSRTMSRLRAAS